jgi:hypothetical protein
MTEILERTKEAVDEQMNRPAREGYVTRRIEGVTSKIPSGVYLAFGIAGMLASAGLAMAGEKHRVKANFIGLWVPTFLIMGLYNKLVKVEGSD